MLSTVVSHSNGFLVSSVGNYFSHVKLFFPFFRDVNNGCYVDKNEAKQIKNMEIISLLQTF